MAYVVPILNCVSYLYLYWRTPNEAAYIFTADVAHLMEFELLEPILILDEKTQFPNSREIFSYYDGPAPNKGAFDCSWVWIEEHGLLVRYVLRHSNRPIEPNHQMLSVSGEIKEEYSNFEPINFFNS